jgi:lipoprotein-anchoring transpeptidase ErfK/SrfK
VVKTVRRLIVSLTVPMLGGLWAIPSAAQTPDPVSTSQPLPIQQLWSTRKPPAKPAQPLWITEPLHAPETHEQPVQLVLRLGERQLYVYRGEAVEVSYPVAVGKPGWETPTGHFEVAYMLEHPGWTNPFTGEVMPPGPENPLGERWIAFWTDGQNEIGFHGTPNRASIGQAASHGCVRLYNEHIRELYRLVNPGTLVTVLP